MTYEEKMLKLATAQTHLLLAMSNAMLSVSAYNNDSATEFHRHQSNMATEILIEVTNDKEVNKDE